MAFRSNYSFRDNGRISHIPLGWEHPFKYVKNCINWFWLFVAVINLLCTGIFLLGVAKVSWSWLLDITILLILNNPNWFHVIPIQNASVFPWLVFNSFSFIQQDIPILLVPSIVVSLIEIGFLLFITIFIIYLINTYYKFKTSPIAPEIFDYLTLNDLYVAVFISILFTGKANFTRQILWNKAKHSFSSRDIRILWNYPRFRVFSHVGHATKTCFSAESCCLKVLNESNVFKLAMNIN